MILTISGTPGTGKTYLAKKISKASKSKIKYFDLNKYIKDHKLYDSYDKKAKTYDVDVKRLGSKIESLLQKYDKRKIQKDIMLEGTVGKTINTKTLLRVITTRKIEGVIVDSHLSHFIKSNYCIIVRSDIKKIHKRLKLRKYSDNKIKENVESEIFEVCLDEARALGRKIISVNN